TASRQRRDESLRAVLGGRTIGDVVEVAGRIVQAATDDAKALTAERDEAERASLLRTVGVPEGSRVPPAVRAQIQALEEDQKRRATRSLRDGLDRVLTDMQSMYRDVVMLQHDRQEGIINLEVIDELRRVAGEWSQERTLRVIDHITDTRAAIEQNAQPALALESLLVTVVSGNRL
ncbi:MAG: DNA polymerase III subunit delta' C-terminal domain-containing protein, partial [Microbacterium sp.]